MLLVTTIFISAQDFFTTDSPSLSINETLLRAGVAVGSFDPAALPADPRESFISMGYKLGKLNGDDPVRAGSLSWILAQYFDIPGGIFYNLIPRPHYALKELQALQILPPELHDRDYISEETAFEAIQKLENMLESGDLR